MTSTKSSAPSYAVNGLIPSSRAHAFVVSPKEVVRAHDERSLTGVVAPVPDPVGVVGALVARVSGFGPLQPFLDDPEVEEIWINDLQVAKVQVSG